MSAAFAAAAAVAAAALAGVFVLMKPLVAAIAAGIPEVYVAVADIGEPPVAAVAADRVMRSILASERCSPVALAA